MALTDTALRKAKSADRPLKLADGGGLYSCSNPPAPGGGAGIAGDLSAASETLVVGDLPSRDLALAE